MKLEHSQYEYAALITVRDGPNDIAYPIGGANRAEYRSGGRIIRFDPTTSDVFAAMGRRIPIGAPPNYAP